MNPLNNARTSAKKRGRGRPQKYPLTGTQINMIKRRLDNGQSASDIALALGVHEYAVLRIRRSL